MKILFSFWFYFFLSIISFSLYWRTVKTNGANSMLFIGLVGILIYFIGRIINDLFLRTMNKMKALALILLILMTITFYAKYCYFKFWDYPALVLTPIFILTAAYYFIKAETKDTKITTAFILYLIMILPLLGLNFHESPRQLLPEEWYNRYDVAKESVVINFPYNFKYKQTSKLKDRAHFLQKQHKFYEAISTFRLAMNIEPDNAFLYFDLSECYAKMNNLEKAIPLLDTAIMINKSQSAFFNNRGLLFYKLKENKQAISDYTTAISLDSTQPYIYVNLALVYYYDEQPKKSCESLEKAKRLGLDSHGYDRIQEITEGICR